MPLNNEVLIQLSHNCIDLTTLEIFGCGVVYTEAGVIAVAERCTGLSFLTIHGSVFEPAISTMDFTKLEPLYPHIKFDFGRMS